MNSGFGGRVALVTGAGHGIGASVALRLAAQGAAVAAFDKDEAGLRERVAEIERWGGRAIAVQGDVRSEADAAVAVARAADTFGGLDLLANIAGVLRPGKVTDLGEDEWDLVIDTNLKSMFLFCKHAVPAMRARGGGAIVNAASVMGFAALDGSAAYCASKGAVVAMTMAMALDHARDNIRINCVAPGSVRTPLLLAEAMRVAPGEPEAELAMWGSRHPIGRLIEPDEVAALICFLLSDESTAITGSCHRVDGGLLAKLAL